MRNTKSFSILIIIAACLMGSPAFAGKIYKWVDEHGVTQFSTFPPLKKEQSTSVTAVNINSGSSDTSTLSCDEICGIWYYTSYRKNSSLTITKDSFYYKPGSDRAVWKNTKGGRWKIEGRTLEVTYTQHQDKSKKGNKEQYYIRMPDPQTLILIPANGGKRATFKQEHDFSNPDPERSGIEQNFVGLWENVYGLDGDSLKLNNKKFLIYGNVMKGKGRYAYQTTGDKYEGQWHVEDPYITLEITADKTYKSEDRSSLVGTTWRWVILKRTAAMFTVRDTATRRSLKFVKISN